MLGARIVVLTRSPGSALVAGCERGMKGGHYLRNGSMTPYKGWRFTAQHNLEHMRSLAAWDTNWRDCAERLKSGEDLPGGMMVIRYEDMESSRDARIATLRSVLRFWGEQEWHPFREAAPCGCSCRKCLPHSIAHSTRIPRN